MKLLLGGSPLTHLSLFSGIGGIDVAAKWAGFQTVGQCELADCPTKVLEKHWPTVPRWRDIKDVTADSFRDKTGLGSVTLISGGYPCQPFSQAGKRRGQDDDRYLWPEMLRVIEDLRPSWVLGENVIGIINMELDAALFDLESRGYTARTFIIPACSVGAMHKRCRVFIVANSSGQRCGDLEESKQNSSPRMYIQNAQSIALQKTTEINRAIDAFRILPKFRSGVLRNDDGLSEGLDRLKCLGNAVVPQQVYPILKAIAEIEAQLQYKMEGVC